MNVMNKMQTPESSPVILSEVKDLLFPSRLRIVNVHEDLFTRR